MRRHGRQTPRGMLVSVIVLSLLGCHSTPSSAQTGSGGESHVYAWGDNRAGQLGDGTTAKRTAPVAVALPTGVRIVSIAAARSVHSLAVDSDGRVYSWGANDDGQLGDGSTVQRSRPQAVALPAGVRALSASAGAYQSLIVGSDSHVYAWGSRAYGEIGDGSPAGFQERPLGVTLAPGVRAVSVAAGLGKSLAVGSDSWLYAWGDDCYGQLGDGSTTQRDTPEALSLPTGARISSVSAGYYHSLSLHI